MIVCPRCSAFVKLTYTGVERSKTPWIGWDPVVIGTCWRHGQVKPVGWCWEEIFGEWDPDVEPAGGQS